MAKEKNIALFVVPAAGTELIQKSRPRRPRCPRSGHRDLFCAGFDSMQLEEPGIGVRASWGRSHRRKELPRGGVRKDQFCVPERHAHGRSPKNGASGHQGVPREGGGGRGNGGDLVETEGKTRSCTASKGRIFCCLVVRVCCGLWYTSYSSFVFAGHKRMRNQGTPLCAGFFLFFLVCIYRQVFVGKEVPGGLLVVGGHLPILAFNSCLCVGLFRFGVWGCKIGGGSM